MKHNSHITRLKQSIGYKNLFKRFKTSLVLCLLSLAIFCTPSVYANESNDSTNKQRKIVSMIGLDIRPSYAFSSYRDDILKDMLQMEEAKKTTFSTSIHLKYGFTFTPETAEGRFYPGVWQGIGTAINMFGNPKGLGTPLSLYLFQGAPIWHITQRMAMYYEWNFGLSMGWKPCDGHIAHSNLIVGSKVNAYINLGVGLQWQIGKDWAVTAGLDLTHFSNGNTSFPNPGVNMAGLRVGITKSFGTIYKNNFSYSNYESNSTNSYNSASSSNSDIDKLSRKHRIGYDFTLYGAWRKRVYRGGQDPVLLNGHFAIAGLTFSPMWRVSKIFRAGVSADFQWDESTDLRRHHIFGTTADDLQFYRPPFFNQVSCGLSGRAELVMPLFSVNLGMGYNIIGPEESRATYQLANLKIRLIRGLYLNIGYQLLDFQRQNNLMLGFGYSFH